MVINKSHDKIDEEFSSGKTFGMAIPNRYLPVQSFQ